MEFGQIIGAIRLNESYEETNSSFECAAWWERVKTIPGIYPLKLGYTGNIYSEVTSDYSLYADISAEVIDDYFPALFGVVSVSNEPYCPKNIGQSRKVSAGISVVEGIDKTGIISGESRFDYYVDPEYWAAFLVQSENKLKKYYSGLSNLWDDYKAGDDEFDSRVGMVAYYGGKIEKYAREIEKIRRRMKWIGRLPGRWVDSKYDLEIFKGNTKWATEYLSTIGFLPKYYSLVEGDHTKCDPAKEYR